MQKIKPKAFGLIFRNQEMLVHPIIESDGHIKGYRPPGGGIEFGEKSEQTLHREFMEEFGVTLKDVQLLGVLENTFTYRGQAGHEILFLYKATVTDPAFYQQDNVVNNDIPDNPPLIWANPFLRPTGIDLFPLGLEELLKTSKNPSHPISPSP